MGSEECSMCFKAQETDYHTLLNRHFASKVLYSGFQLVRFQLLRMVDVGGELGGSE